MRAEAVTQGSWLTFSLSLTLQEHYMASLMPLQKSITPWKVESFQSPYQEGKAQDECPHGTQKVAVMQKATRA